VGRQVKAEIFRGEKRICVRASDLMNEIMRIASESILYMDKI
jgi:hypothetical protein